MIESYEQKNIKRPTRASFFHGKTLDNTMYDTKFLRSIGGFPKLEINAGIDVVLAHRVFQEGKQWVVDFETRSTHIRESILFELKHYYWYGTCQCELKRVLGDSVDGLNRILLRTLFSPLRGIEVAIKKRCLPISVVYPLMRFSILAGIIRSKW